MRDLLTEILESLRRNKLRTALTGFSVAWGIFMIIVLLGAGNGLMNAFLQNGNDVLVNTMQINGWYTTMPYDGLKSGRFIQLDQKDVDVTKSGLFSENIDQVTASLTQNGMKVVYGKRIMDGYLRGIYPEYEEMNKVEIVAGRSLNPQDIAGRKKVALLAMSHVKNLLDGRKDYEEMLGRHVQVGNLMYQVVGIYQSREDSMWEEIYVPFTTLRTIYRKGDVLENIVFTFHGLESEQENDEFQKRYQAAILSRHRAHPEDRAALWIWNRYTQNLQMEKATGILRTALWIIGLFTLLSGIVGVGNIMLITVKERTREFGIRKAIGANPWQINKLIIGESVTITALFGYVGMILGLAACEVLNATVGASRVELFGESVQMLKDPFVDVSVALEATALLMIAGTLAGLFPAIKAAKVRPIEALRAE
ncbi:MAG: ABC transporter permease [Bacteroidales bacterium]|nr:ABC transporter permease [Bacteroidales bacterium]